MLAEIRKPSERVVYPTDTMHKREDFTLFIFRASTVPCYFGVMD